MHYRIYVLNRRFQVLKGINLQAADDVSALERGIALSKANIVEVWQESRLIARIGLGGEAIPDRAYPTHQAA